MKKLAKLFTNRLLLNGLVLLFEILLVGVLIFYTVYAISSYWTIGVVYRWIIIIVVAFAFMVAVDFYILNSKAIDAYKISWLIVVTFLPLLGALLYVLCANKRVTRRDIRKAKPMMDFLANIAFTDEMKKEALDTKSELFNIASYIHGASGTPIFKDTEVTYYKLGDEAFPVMIEELKKAEHYIFMEYFIIQEGKFWNSILDVLVKKAQSGVDVRVMWDDLGSINTLPRHYEEKLRKLGIKAYPFNKFAPLMSLKVNNRDHRKILVIDGKVGFTGGINLADEYINEIDRFGHWKDNAIRLRGRGVYGLTALFLSVWYAVTKEDYSEIDLNRFYPSVYMSKEELNRKAEGFVQPYGDIPMDYEAVGENVYFHIVNRAKKYLYIATPYLLIDSEFSRALQNAAKSGVDVRLLTPHIPDKKTVFGMTRSYYKPLLKAGVHVFEYSPGFVHMKMFVADDVMATCGTINLDYRSLYLHLECGTFLYNVPCIKDMKQDFLDTFAVSEEITYEEYKKRFRHKGFWWGILRLFAPLM